MESSGFLGEARILSASCCIPPAQSKAKLSLFFAQHPRSRSFGMTPLNARAPLQINCRYSLHRLVVLIQRRVRTLLHPCRAAIAKGALRYLAFDAQLVPAAPARPLHSPAVPRWPPAGLTRVRVMRSDSGSVHPLAASPRKSELFRGFFVDVERLRINSASMPVRSLFMRCGRCGRSFPPRSSSKLGHRSAPALLALIPSCHDHRHLFVSSTCTAEFRRAISRAPRPVSILATGQRERRGRWRRCFLRDMRLMSPAASSAARTCPPDMSHSRQRRLVIVGTFGNCGLLSSSRRPSGLSRPLCDVAVSVRGAQVDRRVAGHGTLARGPPLNGT